MTGGLQRLIDRAAGHRATAVDRCGLCAGPVAERHRHVLDAHDAQATDSAGTGGDAAGLMCVCVPCAMLFGRDGAGGGHYELVPERRTRLADVSTEPLRVPVGLAFFAKQSDAAVLAHYPSPMGTTRSDVEAADWAQVETASAALAGMRPRVEALLVWTSVGGARREHWILGIDECFRLAALVRRNWSGMSGGTALWRAVAGFFEELNDGTRRCATNER